MNQNQATECVDSLDAVNGLPLGILADERYELASVQLEPGDTVAMYTDGVSETRDPDGLYFGVDGVKHAMARCSGEAQCLIDTLNYDLGQHLGGRPAEDDVTVVALQVAPQP
jgi:sigma-B regulation protein RsbU (phosphoserine phosphatase)